MECNKEERDVRIVFCAKVLLYRDEWRIRFLCQFCFKEKETLPELLRHALGHFPHIQSNRIEELIFPHVATSHNERLHEEFLIECVGPTEELDNANCSMIYEEYVNEAEDANDCHEETETQINKQMQIENDVDAVTEEEEEMADKETTDDENEKEEENMEETTAEFEFFDVKKKVSTRLKPLTTQEYHIPCLICNKKFRTRQLLVEHKRSHGEKPHVCDICGVGFKEKCNLNSHRARHLGIKPFQCKVCEKSFTTSTERTFHMRTHTGERPYRCTDCDQTFRNTSNLLMHRRRHTSERGTFLCNVCGKSFFYGFELRNHMKTHTTERPLECTKCGSRFKHNKGLRTHMLLHSEVKKFKCKYCSKAFAQHAGVYAHQKHVHADEWKAAKQSKKTDTDGCSLEIEVVS